MKYISGLDIIDIDDDATEVIVLISSVIKWKKRLPKYLQKFSKLVTHVSFRNSSFEKVYIR